MLLGIISDIHGNAEGFDACLEKCRELGVERYVILGDIVGYGPDPEPVTQKVIELATQGAIAILGNHDEAISLASPNMNDVARAAIEWTKPRLSETSRNFLRQLPLTAKIEDVLLVHAEASAPARWTYVMSSLEAHQSLSSSDAAVTFCGHVHVPQLYGLTATAKVVSHTPATTTPIPLSPHRKWLAVMGSAGQPRDGNPAAAFGTYNTSTRELTYCRVPYDKEATAEKIRKVGLPERLAQRILIGS